MNRSPQPEVTVSGAPRAGLLAFALALTAALLTLAFAATPAHAVKRVIDGFIPPPKHAIHELGISAIGYPSPRGVAVNDSSTADPHDGEIYVVDRNRVAAFDSDLNFIRSFGWDVIRPGEAGNIANNERQALEVNATDGSFTLSFGGGFFDNGPTPALDFDADPTEVESALNDLPIMASERQQLTVQATGGTFTLTFDGESTGPIDFDASDNIGGSDVEEALESLPNIDNVYVDYGPGDELGSNPYLITFLGSLESTDVPELSVDDSGLTGGAATATVTTTAEGNSPAVSVTGAPGDYTIDFDGPPLADANVPQIGVDDSGLTGSAELTTLEHGAAYEVCEDPSGCKLGSTPPLGGAMNNGIGGSGNRIAIDQSDGSLYVVDDRNDRIQRFAADGTFLWAAGKGVNADGAPDPDICLAGDACKAGASDGTEASLDDIQGIAVSPADGNVYVGSGDDARVNVFQPDGSFAFMWGVDVAGGGAMETCTSGCQAGQGTVNPGAREDPLTGIEPIDLAVGDGGRVFLTNPGAGAADWAIRSFPDPESAPTDTAVFAPDAYSATVRWLTVDTGPTAAPADDTLYVRTGAILELSVADETLIEANHGVFDSLRQGGGLAHDPDHGFAGDRLLLAGGLRSPEAGSDDIVAVLDDTPPPPAPAPEIAAAAATGPDTATLNGSVDPNDQPSAYRFQYVDEDTYDADGGSFEHALFAPPVGESPVPGDPPGTDPVAVSEDLVELNPGTTYHVRLLARATDGYNSLADPLASAETTFTTDPGPPAASTAAVSAKANSATLAAFVDPHGAETAYSFQYGTEGPCSDPANACTSTPAQSAGTAGGPKHVTHQLTGLETGATYHYRLVAESTLGEASTPDRTVHVIAQSALPEDRAWEKVTPDEKGNAEFGTSNHQASASGHALAYDTAFGTSFPGDEGSLGLDNAHLSTRSPDGSWQTEGLAPRFAPHNLIGGHQTIGYSEDLSRQLVWMRDGTGVPGDGFGPYIRDNVADTFTKVPADLERDCGTRDFLAITLPYVWDPQLEHLAYVGIDCATFDPEAAPQAQQRVFSWSPGDADDEQISTLPGLSIPADITGNLDHRVSADGSRVFWETSSFADDVGLEAQRLYATDEGATVEVSASERSVPETKAPTVYEDATPDGGLVFFTSTEKLTDDSTATNDGEGGELYSYDFSQSEGSRLTDLTPAPGASNGAEVEGVVDVSDAGDRLYFVALARLAPGAVPGRPNLYLWEEGGAPAITHVATLDPDSQADGEVLSSSSETTRTPMATPDARRLVFRSAAKLTAAPTGGHAQVYLYDAPSDRVECVSCRPDGGVPGAAGRLGAETGSFSRGLESHQLRNLSADGSRVFFQTASSLLAGDSNGRTDVYEWREGQLHLISSGRFAGDSTFVDASVDGDSVFFATRERLVPTDTDSFRDAYVARVGGIPPQGPPDPPTCEGDSCQPLPEEPEDPTPASSADFAPGNARATGAGLRRCARPARTAKRHSGRAKRARRGLRRAARASNRRRVVRLRQVVRRHARAAKQNANRAKRCRRAVRARANADRRANR